MPLCVRPLPFYAFLVVVLVALGAPCLRAETRNANEDLRRIAAQHAELAFKAADQGDLKLAEIEYRAALSIAERFNPREPAVESDLLNNLSRMNEKLGNFPLAIEQARLSLERASPDLDVRERDEHEGRIKRMTGLLSQPQTPQQPSQLGPQAKTPVRQPRPVGGIVLTVVGAGLLAVAIGCAAALPGVTERLQGSLTLAQIEALTTEGRTLQGLAIGFGAAGTVATVGGVLWLVKARRAAR